MNNFLQPQPIAPPRPPFRGHRGIHHGARGYLHGVRNGFVGNRPPIRPQPPQERLPCPHGRYNCNGCLRFDRRRMRLQEEEEIDSAIFTLMKNAYKKRIDRF